MGKTAIYSKFNGSLFIILFLLICSITLLSAQHSTKGLTQAEKEEMQIYPGFYVTANHNDTVFGEVQFFNPTQNEITLVFFTEDGRREEYYPADGKIAEYAFEYKRYNKQTASIEPHWFVYVRKLVPKSPIKGGAKEVFLERQIHGDITLYNYYTLVTSKINSRRYKHNYFIEKQGTGGFTLKTIERENYRNMVREYLVLGNQELEENLGTAGFGYKYLSDIVNIQNSWIESNPEYYELMQAAQGKSRLADIPSGNVDLDRSKEKIKNSGKVVIPEGTVETGEDSDKEKDKD